MEIMTPKIKKKIISILKRYNVKRAAVFGSYARGELKKSSDIDILIEFGIEKSLLDLAGLEIELEKLLKRKVDVLTYGSIHPLLKNTILREQKVIL